MITGTVAKQISRTNRNLLVTNLILLAILIGIAALSANLLRNLLSGPATMTMEQLGDIQDPSAVARYWVHVKLDPDQLDNSYYEYTHSSGRSTTTTYYYFYHLKNKGVIILYSSTEAPPLDVEAVIQSTNSEITDHVLPGANITGPFLPVTLDVSNLRIGAYIGVPIWLAFLALVLWNLSKARARMADPLKHPLAVALARFGPPEEIAIAVDAEMQTSATVTGNVTTTTSWLMRPGKFSTSLIFLGDVVWAYMKSTKHKSYGVTTNTTYATVVCDRHGGRVEFPMKNDQVQKLLTDIRSAVPWVIVGYDQKLNSLWTKKNRPQFLEGVEQRKKEYEARLAATPPPPPPPIQT